MFSVFSKYLYAEVLLLVDSSVSSKCIIVGLDYPIPYEDPALA